MDALTEKFVLQFDDPMPGQRTAALEMAREHMAKVTPPETFRGFVQDVKEAQAAKKRADDLTAELNAKDALIQQYIAANKKGQLRYIAAQKVLKWISIHRRPVVAGAAAVMFGLIGVQTAAAVWSWSPSPADKVAFQNLARVKQWREGWSDPAVEPVNGKKYWIVTLGKIDSKNYADAAGQPIEKQCIHLYASPASATFDDYFRPNAFDWSGSIKWPELAMNCERPPLAPRPIMQIPGPGTPRPASENPPAAEPKNNFDFGKPIPPAGRGKRQ